jgi:hypothetical protein
MRGGVDRFFGVEWRPGLSWAVRWLRPIIIGRTPTMGRATLTGQAITRQAMGADPCGTVTPGYAAAK